MKENNIRKNIDNSKKARESSRYQKSGLTNRSTKLSSKNFTKLMSKRGLSKNDISALKDSAMKNRGMTTRHAKKGEAFTVTHGEQGASGIFVSKKSLGNTPEKRINKGSLPHSNSAKHETKVILDKDQNLVYSKIAPQSKFKKMDPKYVNRNGGGRQVITDGGFKNGAVRNLDPKYPIPTSDSSHINVNSFKKSLKSNKNSTQERKMSNQKNKGHSCSM